MKTILIIINTLIISCLYINNCNAQEVYYRPLSNIYSGNSTPNAVNVGVSFEFTNIQTQIIYNLNKSIILFGTYNIDKFTVTHTPLIWGSKTQTKKDNSGYSFGGGIRYKRFEFLVGFEKQNVEINSKYVNSSSKSWNVYEEYYNPFIQTNIIFNKNRFNYAILLKLSYLYLSKLQSDNNPSHIMKTSGFEHKSSLGFGASFGFDYKVLPKRNLIFSSQLGLSNFTNKLKYTEKSNNSYSVTTIKIGGLIAKIGIHYIFNIKN